MAIPKNMTADQLQTLLGELDACPPAVEWCKGKTLAQAWRSSKRANDMLWFAGKMADKPGWWTRKQVVLAACACAEMAKKHWRKEDAPVLQKAIGTARAWCRGKAALEAVRIAAYAAANAAYAANAAVYAAAYAAAYAANAAAYSAYAAAYSAYAAANAAAYAAANAAAYAAAYAAALSEMSSLVRKMLKVGK